MSHEKCNSQESRARKLLDEGKVVHNPTLKVFTVMGTNHPHAVTLFPKETCTCPSTTTCYHILAAKLSIGITVKAAPTRWNLTELRRKARRGVEKRSGRKRPRLADSVAGPAPDAGGHPVKGLLQFADREKEQVGSVEDDSPDWLANIVEQQDKVEKNEKSISEDEKVVIDILVSLMDEKDTDDTGLTLPILYYCISLNAMSLF